MILSTTGHRPNKLGGYNTPNPTFNEICTGMDHLLVQLRPTRVIVGMALGVDQWMAQLCIFNGIPFTAAIPFGPDPLGLQGFESSWPAHAQIKYRNLLRHADRIEYICDPGYQPWKMQRRNEWMVDHSDALLAVFDGTPGGTANCVSYAQRVRKAIHYVRWSQPNQVANREVVRTITVRPAAEVLRDVAVPVRQNVPTPGDLAARRAARERLEEELAAEARQRAIAARERIAQSRREGDEFLARLLTPRDATEETFEAPRPVGVSSPRRRRAPIQETQAEPAQAEVSIPEPPPKEAEPIVHEFGRFIEFE